MPDWHWEPVTDDLLDGLPPAALAAVRQVAEELTVRESMIILDGREFTGKPPGLRTVQRGPLMLDYLTDVRSERVVIIQANWIGKLILHLAAAAAADLRDPQLAGRPTCGRGRGGSYSSGDHGGAGARHAHRGFVAPGQAGC